MALPLLPTAAEVRAESRLRPEQVSPTLADNTALEADITTRISEQANEVERRIMDAAAPLPWPWAAPAWVTATTYWLDQVVTGSTSTNYYRCILAHDSTAATKPTTGASWASYWTLTRSPLAVAYPNYGSSELTAVQTRENTSARLAVKLFALASLYRTAGQGNEYYAKKADDYRMRGEDVMKSLLDEIEMIATRQSDSASSTGKAATLRTGRGTYSAIDPYSVVIN